MRGDIITLRGTPLDGLVRIEDRGTLGDRYDLTLHLARLGQGKPEWRPLPKEDQSTQAGPDGLTWPIWRIPVRRLDLAELRRRARQPKLGRRPEPLHDAAFCITEASYGQDKNELRTHRDPSEFAWAIIDSLEWSNANHRNAPKSGRRPVRESIVIFNPVPALNAGQLWRGDRLWTKDQVGS